MLSFTFKKVALVELLAGDVEPALLRQEGREAGQGRGRLGGLLVKIKVLVELIFEQH